MNTLQTNATLQGGKYKIMNVLGQGGFGITYLAIQSGLERNVAIKEFFIKELCERNESTSHVTLGTKGSKNTVNRFREKFLKEARNIAKLNHPNIIRIIDVFEENGTAYYVMEYAERGSLAEKVKAEGHLSESEATRYILQVAEALDYIHQRKMNHLDVKPANIMLNENDESVLIDFGLSKQYDATTGNQTSTTPVGISEGYAPMEQYKQGGVGEFSPETDIYALGATFFKLLTGTTPPSASDIFEYGIPVNELRARGVSDKTISAICSAMESRKKDRMKNIRTFIDALNPNAPSHKADAPSKPSDDEATILVVETQHHEEERKNVEAQTDIDNKAKPSDNSSKIWLWIVLGIIIIVGGIVLFNQGQQMESKVLEVKQNVNTTQGQQPKKQQIESKNYTANGVSFEMMKVKAGTFTMGATPEMLDPYDDEKPAHKVTLTRDFYIGKTEVTQALWKAVMGSNPSFFKEGDNLPVECVSWYDCQTFISELNSLTGKQFRLPTEAEWEFAARGGNNSNRTQYSGSNNIEDVAWYYDNSGYGTHPVATKKCNELGIYDMSGNVYEWCNDWYGGYSSAAVTNPAGPTSATNRLLRGGCWHFNAGCCRASIRDYDSPDHHGYRIGLRLCLSE